MKRFVQTMTKQAAIAYTFLTVDSIIKRDAGSHFQCQCFLPPSSASESFKAAAVINKSHLGLLVETRQVPSQHLLDAAVAAVLLRSSVG